MKKTMIAMALATLFVSPAFARSEVHHRAAAAHAEWAAPRNGAAINGDGAIQLEERKDAQSGYD
jgi:hypothetical protein